jgi:hypothetical protein
MIDIPLGKPKTEPSYMYSLQQNELLLDKLDKSCLVNQYASDLWMSE